jgi:hypothetical protein
MTREKEFGLDQEKIRIGWHEMPVLLAKDLSWSCSLASS